MKSVLEFLRVNAWLVVAIIVIALGLFQFVDPAPPKQITLATGDEDGRYHELGEFLKTELQKEGVTLNLISTAGSAENMEMLIDPDGPVSVAFVQSGMEQMFDAGDTVLSSLGSLYYEAIWLFYRNEIVLDSVRDLEGYRVAVGEAGSGTRAVAQYLLAENGLAGGDVGFELIEEGGQQAIELLRTRAVDAAFFTVSPQSEVIQDLIDLPGIDFLDVSRSGAYTARYPFLSSVRISEGLIDLERNIPDSDRNTLASTATLVVNDRFHPSFTPLVLEALSTPLKQGGVLEKPGEFPSPSNVGFSLTKEAQHYYKYGPPFLMRYLPFWAASLFDRLVIFIIPLLVIIIPLSKVAGPLYRWRTRSRIYTWYADLLETDRKIVEEEVTDHEEERRKLDALADELAAIEVPLSYSDQLYQLKQHVEYVKRRLDDARIKRTGG
jgi:TRAP transporter TAXI family solute receptor